MFERGRATSYSACGIPYWISGAVEDEAALIARTPDQHRAAGIDVRMRTEVVGIDLDRRTVRWRDLDGGGEGTEPFDELVYATGSVPDAPAGAGHRRRRRLRRAGPRRRRGAARRARQRAGAAGRRRGRRLHRAGDRRGVPRSAVWTSPSSTGPPPRSAPSTPTSARSSPTPSGARASSWCSPTGWPPSTSAPTAGPAPWSPRAAGSCRPTSSSSGWACGRTCGWPRRPGSRWAPPAAIAVDARMRTQVDGRLGGGGLRRVPAPALRAAGGRRAGHARQQAGPGGRHQHRRRVRDLPRRHRHGDHQGLRHGGGAHRAVQRARPRRRATRSSPPPSTPPPRPATSRAPRRSGSR